MSKNGPVSEDKIADMLRLGSESPYFPTTPIQAQPRPPSPLSRVAPETTTEVFPVARTAFQSMEVPGQNPVADRKPEMTFGRRVGT
jgi:hypothetical protein